MLFSEFKNKQVINVKDCRKIGRVMDFEFDHCSGQIKKLVIGSGGGGLCNLFCNEPDTCIWFKDICQIGPDIILVDIKM